MPPVNRELFVRVKDEILGKKYELSIVFIGTLRARTLNKRYRNKTYVPNILSFPLDTYIGEIFINPDTARREAKQRTMSEREYTLFLLIHGMLHLKGMAHSDTMEREEQRLLKKFS